MNFDRRDLNTEAWVHLKADIAARIAALHIENESLNLTPEKTAAVRGRIAELRNLLALERAPVVDPDRATRRRGTKDDPTPGH